jgi:hypothetical protein
LANVKIIFRKNVKSCLQIFNIPLVGWWVGFGCGWAKLNVVFLCRQVRWQNTSFNFAKRWHLNAQNLILPLHPLLLLYNVVCPCFLFVRAFGQPYSLASFGLREGFLSDLPMCMDAKGWLVS